MRRAALVLAVLALAPPALARPNGAGLYAENCLKCHGAEGAGVDRMGPPLVNVGAGTVDFYLRTGYMPLSRPEEQPRRKRVLFDERQLDALIRYVAAFGSGPPIPQPHPERGNVPKGMHLFADHCAGCHQIVARGGVATGARVPPLTDAGPVEVAEAVRAGPHVMPAFSKRALSDAELDSIVRYVEYAKHPSQAGGWGIGFLGPVPEGMVAWLIAAAALAAVCTAIGARLGR